ncbi:hypothetical protein [Mycobacterium deserti]|uniref:Uncharacterized protein n=1 Tax=Mycobacterium deserti TaxID=2978347 RepID=A0ABT2M7A0_9MYCO|nr:hypothetical protein [Mycobacterium deserti]MCT7658146.1 hypothetical protein [Mycobacterium deserti]
MAGFVRRLFRIGKLPGEMRAQAETEGIIHLEECIAAVVRFTGRIPGRKSVGLIRGYGGALVLTNERVLGTLSAIPGKAGRAVDQPWQGPQAGAVAGTLSESGLVLAIADLAAVDPQFDGTFSLTYKSSIPSDVLARLPTHSIAFNVPPKFVYSALGIPRG